MTLISPNAMALIDRVEAARMAFGAEGLSVAGADILIGLGFWRPMALLSKPWEDGSDHPGLGSRIAASPDCSPAVLEELRLYCKDYDWPD